MSAPHAENMAYVRRKGNTKGNFHQFKRWEPPLSIDSKGVVIFTLDSGGTIRDTGKEVFFSAHDPTAERTATLYAEKKWGKRLAVAKGHIMFQPERGQEQFIPEQKLSEK